MRRTALFFSLPGVSLCAGLLLAAPATAEIYKCVGPDGKTTFTSSPGACAGAVPHQPRGTVQTVPSSPSSAGRPPARTQRAAKPAPTTAAQDSAQEARWRAKRTEAEKEKAKIDANLDSYRRVVTGCNRGARYTIKDDTGIKREFSCEEARGTYEQMQQRRAELDTYLSGGLADECRRAGCLPGWIR